MSQEMLRRLARRELTPREIAELLRHAGACDDCARLTGDLDLDAVPLDDEDDGPWHPELTAYADGVADDVEREIVESHLDDCATCREDLADLAALRRTISRNRVRGWRVAVTAAAAATIAAVMILQHDDTLPLQPPPLPHPPLTLTVAPPDTPPGAPRYAHAEWERLVTTAVASAALPFPRETELPPDVLRGAADPSSSKLAPLGVIDETRPELSWPKREGAAYVVSIFAGQEPVAQSEPLASTHWTPPHALSRGRVYTWQVQAGNEIVPAPPAPPATFRIVSQRDHDALAEARRGHPDDFVLHAVLAARAGLRDQAVAALRRATPDATQRKLLEKYVTDGRR
ncbi:MAG TPA: zf-HC2 domain-containing protein [Thermoanaerobaculia bacterium]|nr:zf-HC2 domain-containing protein [Thermoanaerobaculia bacterium]